jgi:CheY-like chemotaxis protein
MTVREQLIEISQLNIATELMKMGDSELNEYMQVLNSFVETFPAQEANIKNALEKKDYITLSKDLIAIKDLLIHIHADTLADECQKQINEFTNFDHEKVETFVVHFLSALTTLSIDIQLTIFKEEQGWKNRPVKTANKAGKEEISILAVDDNAFFLEMLKNILLGTGYKLTCVISSRDALKFLQSHQPDLFILDIDMPQLNGYELAKKVREYGHTAPIIFLTANATKEYLLKAVDAGGVDFIAKPPRREYVLERIARYI